MWINPFGIPKILAECFLKCYGNSYRVTLKEASYLQNVNEKVNLKTFSSWGSVAYEESFLFKLGVVGFMGYESDGAVNNSSQHLESVGSPSRVNLPFNDTIMKTLIKQNSFSEKEFYDPITSNKITPHLPHNLQLKNKWIANAIFGG